MRFQDFCHRSAIRVMPVITSWTQGAWIALDILLVALIIYQVLVMIRGTRAAPMLVGLVVVASDFLSGAHRRTHHAELGRQPRAALPGVRADRRLSVGDPPRARRSGPPSDLPGGSSSESDSYDDIVLAANLFSQHQTGALIVIEREIGLRTHIESGVPLDARLSYDLLATIFRPSAPLHDGAVIVQKDRIAAAACFLPLSMNPLLSTQLGTRHRAGIGITEETDAIAVICSEETGAISLAIGGKIERDLTVEQLRERLGSELRRYMAPVTLPTPIAHDDDESDALLDSPLREPAPQRKSESRPRNRSRSHDRILPALRAA